VGTGLVSTVASTLLARLIQRKASMNGALRRKFGATDCCLYKLQPDDKGLANLHVLLL